MMDFYTCYSTPAHVQPPEHPTSGISLVTSQFLYKPKRYPRLLGMWLLPIAQNTKCRPGFGEDGKKRENTWVEKRQRSSVMHKIFFGGGVFWLVFFFKSTLKTFMKNLPWDSNCVSVVTSVPCTAQQPEVTVTTETSPTTATKPSCPHSAWNCTGRPQKSHRIPTNLQLPWKRN